MSGKGGAIKCVGGNCRVPFFLWRFLSEIAKQVTQIILILFYFDVTLGNLIEISWTYITRLPSGQDI